MSFGMIMQNKNMVRKVKLCYIDTNSFIVYIKAHEVYKDFVEDVETRFDISNYEL